jgi:hypothetical protein
MNRRSFLTKTLRCGFSARRSVSTGAGRERRHPLAIVGMGSKVKIGGMGRNDMKGCRDVPVSESRRSAMSIPPISATP